MADVHLEGVTKNWGAAAAVEDVSFSAPAGHLVALLGPSGCGKSTTLRLIAGLETANSGKIIIGTREGPALRAVPAPVGRGKYPVRPESPQRAARRARCAAQTHLRHSRARDAARPQA